MSPISVTCHRTLTRARSAFATALVGAAFLAAVAFKFSLDLQSAEGTSAHVLPLWAGAVALFLPALISFLSMDVWSEERRTGRLDQLLSIAVRERDFVFGKFFGVWLLSGFFVAVSLFSTWLSLAIFAPAVLSSVQVLALVPALFILALQGALWCAIAQFASACFSSAAASACTSLALLVALPHGLWAALLIWAPVGRPSFGEMFLHAHVADFASGMLSTGVIVSYLVLTFLALFVTSKTICARRFVGQKSSRRRFSTRVTIIMAVLAALSVSTLACRLDVKLDLPVNGAVRFSPRLSKLLTESSGAVTVTGFLPRADLSFRTTSQFLRALKREADSLGGVQISLRFVDPHWDLGPSERLIRLGAVENAIVFEKGRRMTCLPLKDGFDDGLVASALQRVALPPPRRDICWTVGHGESRCDVYDTWGLSDLARDLAREGYVNRTIDLSRDNPVPKDSALLVVAGAKDDFSRAELGRIDAYLRAGGRLLVLMSPPGQGGVASILPGWGIRPSVQPLTGYPTLSGTDVLVSDFADHPVSASLSGSRLVLEKPLTFVSSAVAESGAGADRIEYASVARVGTSTLVAAVERGAGAGNDLSIRPTRILAIGDASFALNGQIAARANANRDFFLNAVAWLSGSSVPGASGREADVLRLDLDRTAALRFALVLILGFPMLVFLSLTTVAFHRRRRR